MGEQKGRPMTEAVYYILLSLYHPLHGYGIIQKIREMTGGRVHMGAGTLYGAISTLLEREYIREYSVTADKKEYIITETGKAAVYAELFRLKELLDNGTRIIGEEDL